MHFPTFFQARLEPDLSRSAKFAQRFISLPSVPLQKVRLAVLCIFQLFENNIYEMMGQKEIFFDGAHKFLKIFTLTELRFVFYAGLDS